MIWKYLIISGVSPRETRETLVGNPTGPPITNYSSFSVSQSRKLDENKHK